MWMVTLSPIKKNITPLTIHQDVESGTLLRDVSHHPGLDSLHQFSQFPNIREIHQTRHHLTQVSLPPLTGQCRGRRVRVVVFVRFLVRVVGKWRGWWSPETISRGIKVGEGVIV